jgi:chorismate synthase
VPARARDPVFGKLDALLAYGLMGIGAVKGVEIGSGFAAANRMGSENNDPIGPTGFLSNNAGGILGGISTGQEIVVRAAVKPISSIEKEQQTITQDGQQTTISVKGRHDVSAIPRIVPVCAAMVRLVLVVGRDGHARVVVGTSHGLVVVAHHAPGFAAVSRPQKPYPIYLSIRRSIMGRQIDIPLLI